MEKVLNLPDVNPSDTVYTDGQNFVKVRVLEVPIDAASDPQAARNCIVLEISASVCGADGKALPDDALGYLIAPASRHTNQLQGMVEKSIASQGTDAPKSPPELIEEWVEELMLSHAKQALLWLAANQVKARFVKYQPPALVPAEVVTEEEPAHE
ncbi:hypothetical protein HPT27_10625 [Permianibacter sp. IMCC34836]|uniref:hypothetical protein n=1 Tax=Permianibacter fluminis TaxID=2738515 RepID=UPI0015517CCA|nr:hypothetical protein [Permianibacter fluminis]NQD37482.1 hypothetical protein [Permianibacter fluminis]